MYFRYMNRLHIILIWLTIVYLSYKIYFNHNVKLLSEQSIPFEGKTTRRAFFTSIAKDNLIILSTTDYHYLDLALNLHQSIVKFNISNYVVGCTDLKACAELKRRNIQWAHFYELFRFLFLTLLLHLFIIWWSANSQVLGILITFTFYEPVRMACSSYNAIS